MTLSTFVGSLILGLVVNQALFQGLSGIFSLFELRRRV